MAVELTASACTFCGGAVGTVAGRKEGREEGEQGEKQAAFLTLQAQVKCKQVLGDF